MNNTPPKAPEIIENNNKTKYIVAIIAGIAAVVASAFGIFGILLYIISIGLIVFSIIYSVKYFKVEKLAIIALIVSMCSALVIGYSIIRTALVAVSNFAYNYILDDIYDYDYGIDEGDFFDEDGYFNENEDFWN